MYDNDDQASFVLLGDAGHELSGKKASELVDDYFEVIQPRLPLLFKSVIPG